jgi:hypothetical protein
MQPSLQIQDHPREVKALLLVEIEASGLIFSQAESRRANSWAFAENPNNGGIFPLTYP